MPQPILISSKCVWCLCHWNGRKKEEGEKKKERVRKLEEHRKIKKSPGGEFISHWSLSGEHHKTQTVSHHWKTSGPAGPAVLVTESDKLPPPLQWKTARDTVVHAPQSVCGLQQFQTINWNMAECNVQNCTCCNFWIKINVWQCDAEVINVLCCLHYEAHCSYNKCVFGAFCICINEKREMGRDVSEQISLIHWRNTVRFIQKAAKIRTEWVTLRTNLRAKQRDGCVRLVKATSG